MLRQSAAFTMRYSQRRKIISDEQISGIMKQAAGIIYRLPVLMPVRADPGRMLIYNHI